MGSGAFDPRPCVPLFPVTDVWDVAEVWEEACCAGLVGGEGCGGLDDSDPVTAAAAVPIPMAPIAKKASILAVTSFDTMRLLLDWLCTVASHGDSDNAVIAAVKTCASPASSVGVASPAAALKRAATPTKAAGASSGVMRPAKSRSTLESSTEKFVMPC